MSDQIAKELHRTLRDLLDSPLNDQRLRDQLEGYTKNRYFPGLTWFWGPLLYERNRAIFRSLILSHFSDWAGDPMGRTWKRVGWNDHADRLQTWLDAARASRDTQLVRRLLRWKYAAKKWGIDERKWIAALAEDYSSAGSAAQRAVVLDEYDDWFALDEPTALRLYQIDRASRNFILKHLPQTAWGDEKRTFWGQLSQAALAAEDQDLHFKLYQKQMPIARWQAEILTLAQNIADPANLQQELQRRHPEGYGLKLVKPICKLLEARGRDVLPYVRGKLKEILSSWHDSGARPFVKLAERQGWWDLWAEAIRAHRNNKLLNKAVPALLLDEKISEKERIDRLQALAGVSREWNWPRVGLAQVHALNDSIARDLYAKYPDLIRGPYKPNITPRWWQGTPLLLSAAQAASDSDLVDLLASRYATQVQHDHYYYNQGERKKVLETAESLSDYYQAIREEHSGEFARRAANVLTRIPAFSIFSYQQLLRTNKLARLLLVRSFDAYLKAPDAVQDLVEGSDIHVQMLAYRVLSQADDRAGAMAVDNLEILLGTLLRPLHRKTRIAAFGALLNAARTDAEAAKHVLARSRESLRLPDKKYPKERLVGLIGEILHACPELRGPEEQPIIYGLEEATA